MERQIFHRPYTDRTYSRCVMPRFDHTHAHSAHRHVWMWNSHAMRFASDSRLNEKASEKPEKAAKATTKTTAARSNEINKKIWKKNKDLSRKKKERTFVAVSLVVTTFWCWRSSFFRTFGHETHFDGRCRCCVSTWNVCNSRAISHMLRSIDHISRNNAYYSLIVRVYATRTTNEWCVEQEK